MGITFVLDHNVGSATSNTPTFILADAVPAGRVLVVFAGFDNTTATAPAVTSIDVPVGETASWVLLSGARVLAGATATAGSGVIGEMWAIKTTQTWPSGTIVTVTLSASVKVALLPKEFSGAVTTLRGTTGTNTSTAGAPSAATSGTALVAGDLVLGGAVGESSGSFTTDADTTNGSWSTILNAHVGGGASAAQVEACLQHKIVTAPGVQTYNPAGLSAGDAGAVIVSLQPDPSATVLAATIACVAALPAVTLAENATATPATIACIAGIGAPTVSGGGGGGGGGITGRTATLAESASATSIAGTLPTDRQAGDVVVAHFAMSSTVANFTPPAAEWLQLVAPTADSAGVNTLAAYYAFDPSAAPTGTTTVAGRQTCICQAYGGVNNSTPVDVAAQINTGAAPLTISGITTVTAGARLLSGVVINASTGTFTQPTGMTLIKSHTSGVGRGGALADETPAGAGATGTRQWVWSGTSQGMAGYLTALRPATTGSATATPGTIGCVAGLGAVTVSVSRTATPATIAVVAGVGPVKRLLSFAATTGTITGLQPSSNYQVTIRAVDTSGNRSADSAAITVTTTAPGSTATPATIAATAAIPTPIATGSATVAPATLAATTAVGAATVTFGAAVSPARIAAVAAIPTPTVTAGGSATANPATLSATSTVGAPTVRTGWTVSVGALAATAALPAVTVHAGATATPATIATSSTVGAPTVTVGGSASPATISTVAAIPAVSVGGGTVVTPATLTAFAAIGTPALHAGWTVTVATIATVANLPTALASGGTSGTRNPATIAALVAIGSAAVSVSGVRSPQSIAVIVGIGSPTLLFGAQVLTAVIAARVGIPTPTVQVKTTYRPYSGTTSRPGTGTTVRPFTGTNARP